MTKRAIKLIKEQIEFLDPNNDGLNAKYRNSLKLALAALKREVERENNGTLENK